MKRLLGFALLYFFAVLLLTRDTSLAYQAAAIAASGGVVGALV